MAYIHLCQGNPTTAGTKALAPDNAGSAETFGAYGASLTISSVVGATLLG